MFSGTTDVLMTLDWLGTAVFAFSGTITGGKNNMDLIGCLILSSVNAMGGGTIRDLLTGQTPVFWVRDPNYIRLCVATSLLTFFLWPEFEKLGVKDDFYALKLADTIGMGAFAVLGAQIGVSMGFDSLVSVSCGMMSATFGGVVRDVLCRQPVRIMHRVQCLYATPAIIGGALFVFLHKVLPQHEGLDALCGFVFAVGLRILAIEYKFYWF